MQIYSWSDADEVARMRWVRRQVLLRRYWWVALLALTGAVGGHLAWRGLAAGWYWVCGHGCSIPAIHPLMFCVAHPAAAVLAALTVLLAALYWRSGVPEMALFVVLIGGLATAFGPTVARSVWEEAAHAITTVHAAIASATAQ